MLDLVPSQTQESTSSMPDATSSYRLFSLPNDPAALLQHEQRLGGANRKIDHYSHLIASLSGELKHYRDTICDSCKDKVLLTTSSPTASLSHSAVTPTASRISSEPAGITAASSYPESSSHPSMTGIEPSPPLALSLRGHGPNSFIRGSRATHSDAASTFSVEYNPKIKQRLDLSIVKIFEFGVHVLCVKFSRDGTLIAVLLANDETHIYDISTVSKSVLVEHETFVIYSEAMAAPKSEFNLTSVRFSPDSKYIATGGWDKITIWEIERKRVCAIFKGRTNLIKCIDFSPDGRFLASASADGTVRMWNIRDGSSRWLSYAATSDFNSVAFSPDGRYVAAGNDDGHLRIWDARRGHLLKKWKAHADGVVSVAFEPDGKGMASGGFDHTWKSWDLCSLHGNQLLRKSGRIVDDKDEKEIFSGEHTDLVTSTSFSSDGRWILTSSGWQDRTSRIWDAETGVWVCTLKGHTKSVWVDVSPAGQYLVTGSFNGQVILWRYHEVDG